MLNLPANPLPIRIPRRIEICAQNSGLLIILFAIIFNSAYYSLILRGSSDSPGFGYMMPYDDSGLITSF